MMKKSYYLILLCCLVFTACGGKKVTKPTAKPVAPAESTSKSGGYYLDDGPHAQPPKNLDEIPDAIPKDEPLLARANKPYVALGKTYVPLKSAENYKDRGVASWYGKRYHGNKTSSGEIYDMYSMTAAHTILPLPSYVKVTNPANGRSVIVRVNDRGPFKHSRIIDLSYVAAYKLDLIEKGSGIVEIETVQPGQLTNNTVNTVASTADNSGSVSASEGATSLITATASASIPETSTVADKTNITSAQYYIQAGAFKNEANAMSLVKRIQGLDIDQNVGVNSVYNDGLHRIKLGPYASKQDADQIALEIRKQLNVPTIINYR